VLSTLSTLLSTLSTLLSTLSTLLSSAVKVAPPGGDGVHCLVVTVAPQQGPWWRSQVRV
jgi:hypothetical protein